MKSLPYTMILVLVFVYTPVSFAALVGDQNWADDVEDYSDAIQNYDGQAMAPSTTWWLTGPPDASVTDDYVGGWRSDAPNEHIIMHWISPLIDWPGDDLVIRMFSGPAASANVLASVDGVTYSNIGTLGAGIPQMFQEESFDLAGQFDGDISYVKVERVANGPQSGIFFDAFGSTVAPDLIPGDANDDKKVDEVDALALAQNWCKGNATWEMGDFNGDDVVGAADASILAAHWGHGTQETSASVPEPSTCLLLAFLPLWFWRRR